MTTVNIERLQASRARGSRLGKLCLALAVAGLLLFGDLGDGNGEAEAHPEMPPPAEPAWNTLASDDRLARRRRRRRPRRRPRRRKPPAAKSKPAAPAPAPAAQPATSSPPPSPGALQRGSRVEFDGRLVQGQTAKSGAIYLFARRRSELRSMVKERQKYRKEILRTVYPTYGE